MLTKKSRKILRFAHTVDKISIETVTPICSDPKKTKDMLVYLTNLGFLKEITQNHFSARYPVEIGEYQITPHGEAYLENIRFERFRFWIPIIISLIMSAAALIVSILK